MGHHGPYVWSAYGISLLVLAINVAEPLLARRRYLQEEARRLRRRPSSESGPQETSDHRPRHRGGRRRRVGLALSALQQNINLFYTPTQIANGEAPTDTRIRAGGLVEKGFYNAARIR